MPEKINRDIELTNGTIILRPYRRCDIKATYEAVRESIMEMSPWLPFVHANYSLKESREWIKQRPKDWHKGISYEFTILEAGNGMTKGGCGINQIDYNNLYANLGYWVRTSRTGHGTAAVAARLLAEWGFKALGLKRIEIVVATGNMRSQRAAEKAGAKREGILRNRIQVRDKTYDAVMFSLIPKDFDLK
jgi:ribosomal-protein-serine acetyltransferase